MYTKIQEMKAQGFSQYRTANAKIHGATRKVPAEVFKQERDYLKPVPITENCVNACVRRTLRKDNTIIYNSNRRTFRPLLPSRLLTWAIPWFSRPLTS